MISQYVLAKIKLARIKQVLYSVEDYVNRNNQLNAMLDS